MLYMSSIDQQFIEYVVKALVSNPDEVIVERRIDEKGVLLELTVDPEDLGRVIGKRGATAQSLRTLLRALGTKNDARYNLKIVDNGVGGGAAAAGDEDDDDSDDDAQSPAATPAEVLNDQAAVDTEADVPRRESEDDRVSKTRKELAELDDLDV
jgi:predicted RNA-binding protein YlqC (UPF0109 family)